MRRILYFRSAWGDIKNSPRWFGKLCLLALIALIPVFGQLVVLAYLYGWAREIAWGTHEPLPAKIFANEDGKFWRRGWFVLVLSFVFMLVPYLVVLLGSYWQGLGFAYTEFGARAVDNPLLVGLGTVMVLVGSIGSIILMVLAWIGNMRVSIYDRLSAGFQLGKIWKMMRHDSNGILRIFGMDLLVSFILVAIWWVIFMMLMFLVAAIVVMGAVGSGQSLQAIQGSGGFYLQSVLSAGLFGIVAWLVVVYVYSIVTVFVQMLVIRAVGYWTMQFDVPRWGGQDDPLPFELYQPQQAVAGGAQAHQQTQASVHPQPQPHVQSQPAAPAVPSQRPAGAPSAPSGVSYDTPAVVGSEFIMSSDTSNQIQAEIAEQREELEAQGAHGVQDSQAGDAHVGEDGEPHVGEPEGGKPQD